MARPELWLVAGPNGAGKTTLAQRGPLRELLPRASFLNPDDRALEFLRAEGFHGFSATPPEVLKRAFVEAANATLEGVERCLQDGEAVCVETVLSTDKYCRLMERVLGVGGRFFLIYVALRSPELAAERVRCRTRLGGHDVPLTKVRERWRRSLGWLPWLAARATPF